MSLLEKFTDLFKKDRIIHLDGEVQDDGYLYVYSNDIKGFSLMLEPDQWKDFGSLIQSVEFPLLAYIDAYEDAKKNISKTRSFSLAYMTNSKAVFCRLLPLLNGICNSLACLQSKKNAQGKLL